MTRTCEWCDEPIAFLDAQTTSGNSAWHTRCWNQSAEQLAAYIAECEDSEGFARRPLPDELPMSETGPIRSEVIPIMATAASNTRPQREVVEFPPNTAVTVALKYPQARTVSSQYGERFMFTLADGRVMFLDPEVGGKIESLGVNVRENFTITRKWDERERRPPRVGSGTSGRRTTERNLRGSSGSVETAGIGRRCLWWCYPPATGGEPVASGGSQ